MGVPGTGMELHRDNLRNHVWGIQLSGTKSFTFCDPSMAHVYKIAGGLGDSSPINVYDKNVRRDWPVFSESGRCYQAELHQGDLVYWPSNWLHQSQNKKGLSIALSSMNID